MATCESTKATWNGCWLLVGIRQKGRNMADPAPHHPDDGPGDVPRLALRPKEAAAALGIGRRLLWTLTNCGEIPHARLGRAVVYPADLLRAYLVRKATEATR